MAVPTLTNPPPAPVRGSATFSDQVADFLAWLIIFKPEMDAAIAYISGVTGKTELATVAGTDILGNAYSIGDRLMVLANMEIVSLAGFVSGTNQAVNNYAATSAPTATDDSASSYSVGSTWVDTANDNVYICVDATVGAAVWSQVNGTGSGSGSGTVLQSNYVATAAPNNNDDTNAGYSVGSFWVDQTAVDAYICVDNSAGAAVWLQIDDPTGAAASIQNNYAGTTAPNTNDDSAAGYSPGSVWVDQVNVNSWLCIDNTAGAAVWVQTNVGSGGGAVLQSNYNATTAPAVTNDNTEGYARGSRWIDTVADVAYILVDDSTGAAVWAQISSAAAGGTDNLAATTAPTVTDDSGSGYAVGSLWIDTTNDNSYILVDDSVGAAVWLQTGTSTPSTTPQSNLSAGAAPTVTDDGASGYAVGSIWADTTNGNAYVLLDATNGAAVWSQINNVGSTPSLLHNYAATAAPTVTDDGAAGYSVGSNWIDVTNDNTYKLVDATNGAAVWIQTNAAGSGGTGGRWMGF